MTILTVFSDPGTGGTTVDGEVERTGVADINFTDIRNGAGNASDDTGTTTEVSARTDTGAFWSTLSQWIGTFDTSPIGTGTINSVKLDLWFTTKGNNFSATGVKEIHIAGANPASNNALVNADFGAVSRTSFANISHASTPTGVYTTFTFNASGESEINKTGITQLSSQISWDLNNVFDGDLDTSRVLSWTISTADGPSDQRPKLVIDFTPTEFFVEFNENTKMTPSLTTQASKSFLSNVKLTPEFFKSPEIKIFTESMKLTSSISKSFVTLVEFTTNMKMESIFSKIQAGFRKVVIWTTIEKEI